MHWAWIEENDTGALSPLATHKFGTTKWVDNLVEIMLSLPNLSKEGLDQLQQKDWRLELGWAHIHKAERMKSSYWKDLQLHTQNKKLGGSEKRPSLIFSRKVGCRPRVTALCFSKPTSSPSALHKSRSVLLPEESVDDNLSDWKTVALHFVYCSSFTMRYLQ